MTTKHIRCGSLVIGSIRKSNSYYELYINQTSQGLFATYHAIHLWLLAQMPEIPEKCLHYDNV